MGAAASQEKDGSLGAENKPETEKPESAEDYSDDESLSHESASNESAPAVKPLSLGDRLSLLVDRRSDLTKRKETKKNRLPVNTYFSDDSSSPIYSVFATKEVEWCFSFAFIYALSHEFTKLLRARVIRERFSLVFFFDSLIVTG